MITDYGTIELIRFIIFSTIVIFIIFIGKRIFHEHTFHEIRIFNDIQNKRIIVVQKCIWCGKIRVTEKYI